MEIMPAEVRQAWQTLRRTPLRLRAVPPQKEGSRTGFSPTAAAELLTGQGFDATRAAAAVQCAILTRFGAFADSWDSYIDYRGWLLDLLAGPADQREALSDSYALGPVLAAVETLRTDPSAALADLRQWGPLLQSAGGLERRRESGQHPAGDLMVARYGLHPELARAVLLHSRIEPWWAHIALAAAWLICGLVFLQALVASHSPAFENASVGGVGPLHYIVLPLFTLAFLAVQVWLLRTRPQRQRQWRAQLAKYVQTWEEESRS